MIDTIALVLDQKMFKIINHAKFSPSTEGLYNSSNYYRLGGRGNFICKQNPTISELKQGIYKPRLSVTKRFRGYNNYQIVMRIDFSAPKLLFGNNFDELENNDFDAIVTKLQTVLFKMGVIVTKPNLINASVSAIHYSKNIPLIDYTTPYIYLKEIYKINLNQRLDFNQTDFRNEGHSLKYRANNFEIAFYDKLKDLQKAKTSEKRSEEKDNAIQLNLFNQIEKTNPFEILRMEVRLNNKQKVKKVLKLINQDNNKVTFKTLFSGSLARKMLLYYINEIKSHYNPLFCYSQTEAQEVLLEIINHNEGIKLTKALKLTALKLLLDKLGTREFREIIKRFGKRNWYRLNKETQSIKVQKNVDKFGVIFDCINKFETFKLVDFQDGMLNNDKYETGNKRSVLFNRRGRHNVKSRLSNSISLDKSKKIESFEGWQTI